MSSFPSYRRILPAATSALAALLAAGPPRGPTRPTRSASTTPPARSATATTPTRTRSSASSSRTGRRPGGRRAPRRPRTTRVSTYFPPPKFQSARGTAPQGIGFGFGHSGSAFEFPFTHSSSRCSSGTAASHPQPITLRAYDVDGVLIASDSENPAGGPVATPMAVTSFDGRIHSIELDGTGSGWAMDDLTVDVPDEPAAARLRALVARRSAGQVPIGADDTVDVQLGSRA